MSIKYDENIFYMPESIDMEEFVVATYFVEGYTKDLLTKAGSIAIEQSTGSWLPVPLETPAIRKRHTAKVIGVHEIPAYEFNMPEMQGKERKAVIQLAFPFENSGANLSQLLTAIIGNISMAGKLKLIDVQLPKKFTDGFQGPRFGVDGLRELMGVPKRPLVVSMIKPCTGAKPKEVGELVKELAYAGIDWIKDDELFGDTAYSTVKDRTKYAVEALEEVKAKTGKNVIYSPNITDRPDLMLEKAHMLKDLGVNGLMINALTTSWPAMQMIAEDDSIDLPILAHPAFAGAMYNSHYSGISSHLALGKFMRICGADIVIYPCSYGKVDIQRERYVRIAQSLLTDMRGMKRTVPGPAAGVYQGLIPDVAADIGLDFSISAGAAIHAHKNGATAGVESLIKAAEITAEGGSLEEAAKTDENLRIALEDWGIGVSESNQMFELQQ